MKPKIKITDKGWNAIKAKIKIAKGSYTSVGVHEDAGNDGETPLAMIGAVHEYGCDIKNGFGRGIFIHIPERSWLRGWIDENRPGINSRSYKLWKMILANRMEPMQALGILGEFAVSGVKRRIRAHIAPPLAEATKNRKDSSTPLIDTGGLISSIHHKEKHGGHS